MFDQKIINQYFYVGMFRGTSQADILEQVAKQLREDPGKPSCDMVILKDKEQTYEGIKAWYAEAHFHFKKGA